MKLCDGAVHCTLSDLYQNPVYKSWAHEPTLGTCGETPENPLAATEPWKIVKGYIRLLQLSIGKSKSTDNTKPPQKYHGHTHRPVT